MSQTVKEKIESGPMFDMAIDKHQFAHFGRDYDVFVDVSSAKPAGGASHISERVLYRFTHCAFVEVTTRVDLSWDDVFTNYEAWQRAGSPEGYFWNCYQFAYPGEGYVDDSELARG